MTEKQKEAVSNVILRQPPCYKPIASNRIGIKPTGHYLLQKSNFSTLIAVNSFRMAMFLMKEADFS